MAWREISEVAAVQSGKKYRITLLYELPYNQLVVGTMQNAIKLAAAIGGPLAGFKIISLETDPPKANSQGKLGSWPLRVVILKS